jgi:hypothetical protein
MNVDNANWVMLTKRTEDPKLTWLQRQLARLGIRSRRNGASFHAPILEVHKSDEERAWAFLGSQIDQSGRTVDDIDDDDPMFI